MSEILPRLSEDNQNNDMAVNADIRDARMSAVQRDILNTSADSKGDAVASGEWFIFDVAVMSMALHHIASPEDAGRLLVERLRSGRIVRLIDWVLDLVKFHGADFSKHAHNVVPGSKDTCARAGFVKDEMFGDARQGWVSRRRLHQASMPRLFLAKGRKVSFN
ncbi:MAG: hypothetical protein Q9202_003652 [Teloschistes flavicans]